MSAAFGMDSMTKSAFFCAQILLLVLATGCGQADEHDRTSDGRVVVSLSPAPDQRFLLAEFALTEPVSQFVFEPPFTRINMFVTPVPKAVT